MSYIWHDGDKTYIRLKVKPGSKFDRILDPVEIMNKIYLKVQIRCIPENSRANYYLERYIGSKLKVDSSLVEVIKGHRSSLKVISVKRIVDQRAIFP